MATIRTLQIENSKDSSESAAVSAVLGNVLEQPSGALIADGSKNLMHFPQLILGTGLGLETELNKLLFSYIEGLGFFLPLGFQLLDNYTKRAIYTSQTYKTLPLIGSGGHKI